MPGPARAALSCRPTSAMARLQEAARELGLERAGVDGWQLNEGQLAAGVAILSGSDRFLNIQGVAGAGKSTLLGALDKVLGAEGVKLIGLAFQNKMVADLRGGGFGHDVGRADARGGDRGLDHRRFRQPLWFGCSAGIMASASRRPKQRSANTVIITDESSMVSSRDMLRLTTIAERLDLAKAPFMGDRQQLSAIEQGKMFAVSQAAGQATVRMDENIRQKNSPLLLAVAGLSNEGHAGLALDLLAAHGRVIEARSRPRRAGRRPLAVAAPEKREATAIFTAGRDDRTRDQRPRPAGLLKEGSLTGLASRSRRCRAPTHPRGTALCLDLPARPGARGADGCARDGASGAANMTVAIGARTARSTLERDGKRKVIDPDRIDPDHRFDRLGLYDQKDIRIHDGETVFWRDKDAARDIAKSTYATVLRHQEAP
jgi:hypothetical protein